MVYYFCAMGCFFLGFGTCVDEGGCLDWGDDLLWGWFLDCSLSDLDVFFLED